MIVLIDNYDSFVHNLARYFRNLGQDTQVIRNDAITADDLLRLNPMAVVLSPGPCTPNEAGNCLEIVSSLGARLPMLGVCLGHQVIGASFGAKVVRAETPMHGKASLISHSGTGLFKALPQPLRVGRYHSLVIEPGADCLLNIDSRAENGEVMAISHPTLPLWGVQFHPESILSDQGERLLSNFLELAQSWHKVPR